MMVYLLWVGDWEDMLVPVSSPVIWTNLYVTEPPARKKNTLLHYIYMKIILFIC